jgi:hypothetical protein
MPDFVFLAYAHHSFFEDMTRSLGRGLMYGFGFKVMRALSMPGAVAVVLVVLAIAFVLSRRAP